MTARTLPTSLGLFLALALCVLLSAGFYANNRQAAELRQRATQEQFGVKLAATLLDRRLQAIVLDLEALAGTGILSRLLTAPTPEASRQATAEVLNFAGIRRGYHQIRLLDLNGRERLAIDLRGGPPQALPPGDQLPRTDQPYFQAAMALSPGQPLLSTIGSSKEGRPALLAATPVTDSRGLKAGLLVFSYPSEEWLAPAINAATPVLDHLMIVGRDSRFLLPPRPETLENPDGQFTDPDLSHRHPASWAQLAPLTEGQFEDENGLWSVASVFPGQAARPSGSAPHPTGDEDRWQVIARVTPDTQPSLFSPLKGAYGVSLAAQLLLCAGMAYFLVRYRSRKESIETRFRIYFDHAMVGMAVTDAQGRWQVVNPALCQMLGYSQAELQGKTWQELTHPDDLMISEEPFKRVIRGEVDGYKIDKRYIRADGKIINAYVAVQGVRESDGRIKYLIGIFEDITARVAAQQALRLNEERLRRLGDNLPDSYVYQMARDAAGAFRFLYVSSGISQIHGYEPEQVVNDAGLLFNSVSPEHLPPLLQAIGDSERTARDFVMELQVRHASGRPVWLQLRSRPRRQEDGTMIWDGVALDITARREAAALIQLQARRSETLLDLPIRRSQMDEGAFLTHAVGQIEALTDSRIALIHFVQDDAGAGNVTWSHCAQGNCRSTCETTQSPLLAEALWEEVFSRHQPVVFNDLAAAPPTALPTCPPLARLVGVPVIDEGRIRLIAAVGNSPNPYDATAVETIQLLANTIWRVVHQYRAEQALKVALQVVNASPVVCFRWRATPTWPVVFVSDNVAQWGYSVDGLLAGQPVFKDMVHPDDLARVAEEVAEFNAEGRSSYIQEYRLLTADNRTLWVTDRTQVLRNAAGEVEFYDGVLTDISERRQKDLELNATLTAQRQLNKRLEEAHNQLLQSEKMASIGQLAAGIAHELNNPIGFVHSNLGTLDSYLRDLMDILDAYDQALAEGGNEALQARLAKLKEERDFDYMRQDLGQLLVESKDGLARVRKIVQDLKSFSHVSEQDWQWVDLHQGLDSTLNIVWNELKYKCQVVKDYGDLPKVYCLISQLNQVFMNLLVNAGHAIETKGTITIHTARRGDNEVIVEIRDTGKGIAPEHLSRIFEPFFTTKPVGKGTGLGLSLSYGIVDKHHGRIEVDSQVGVGSTFRIILPISQETGPEAGQPTEVAP